MSHPPSAAPSPARVQAGVLPPGATTRARWFGTLKARLMLASTLVIAASVAVTTSVVLQRVQERSESALIDLERDSAERMAAVLGRRVQAMQHTLRATAAAVPAAALVDAAAAAAHLTTQPALLAGFAGVSIVDASGRVLAVHDGQTVTQPTMQAADRLHFQQAIKGAEVVSQPMQGRMRQEPVITLAMPVFDADGRVAAVLCGWIRLAGPNLFDDLTHSGHGGANGVFTVVTDGMGTVISHPQRGRLMQAIAGEPTLAAVAAQFAARVAGPGAAQLAAQLGNHQAAHGLPTGTPAMAVHAQGRFISMAGVPGAGWMLFRQTPDTELLGGLAQAREQAMWWAGGVALAGGLLILALLALLLGPLSRLRERALQLQDPACPIEHGWPAARGEIGELSRVLQQVLRERAAGEQAKQLLVQQMGSVLAAAPIGIAFTRDGRFELAGAEFHALLGWPDGGLIGRQSAGICASAAAYEALGAQVAAAFAARRPYFGEMEFKRCDGSTFWGRAQGRPVDAADAGAGTIWLLEDVTERREARLRLSWSASHDVLTRLLNRGAFTERLAAWLEQPQPGVPAALLFVDLDRFKQINDSAGHAAGDGVLRDVAAVLQAHVRAGDAAARLGGDEFALLLPGCVAAVALQLAEQLRAAIALVGVEHAGRQLSVGASIGVVQIDADAGSTATAWLARADAACYDAKHAGRNCVRQVDAAPLPCLADAS